MRRWICALLLAAFVAPAPALSQAAKPACAGQDMLERMRREDRAAYERIVAEHARIPNGSGNLWRIERQGLKPSYLFGTVHVADSRAVGLVDGLSDELSASDVLLLELDEAEQDPVKMAAAMASFAMLPEAETLDERLTEDERARLGAATAAHGLPWFLARRMRPAFLNVALSIPACAKLALLRGEPVLDARIESAAREAGLRVVALETMEEQLGVVGRLDDDIQLAALVETAGMDSSLVEDLHETLIVLHQQGTAAMADPLIDVLAADFPAARAAADDMRKPLIEERNSRMVARALPYVEEGGAFIAVGALHLPGETGLVEGFRRAGFTVTRID